LRNFIFEDFSEIDNRFKTRENKDGMIESEFKSSLQIALRYFNMKLNSGNKNEHGGSMNKEK
jgi:hypothetical protein